MDISPDKQNIDRVFSNTTYYIDFYQRDYRWTEPPVTRLLDDVFFKFREQYQRSKDLDPSKETITTMGCSTLMHRSCSLYPRAV